MDKRTVGLTSFYSVVFSGGGQRQLSPRDAGRRLFGPVASGGQAAGVLLRNGGRLDLDAVSRPGYATPDCGSVPDLVVHDKAGERILEGMLADAGQRLREEGGTDDISVLKIGADPAGSSFGCQEDYLIARRGEFGRLADVLIPFLVTRQLICGTGAVVRTPRALLKAGATDLVLRMAEAGTVMPGLIPDSAVHQAMGEVSRDITGRSLLRLADGRQLTALDIQREYLARARDFTGEDPVSQRVLGLWQRALDAIGTGNLGAIAREIDWAIKYQLIERYRAAHDLPLSAPQVARADLAYHDIRRGRGLYYQLQRDGAVERTARDIDIFEAKTVPPAPGRYRQAG